MFLERLYRKSLCASLHVHLFNTQLNIIALLSNITKLVGATRKHNIIIDRVRSTREGNVLTRVCPSICLSTPRRVTPQPGPVGGGPPQPGPAGGVLFLGGTPARGRGVPYLGLTPLWETDGVLDMLRSVCLLRSRRRTFLFKLKVTISVNDSLEKSCFPLLGPVYIKRQYQCRVNAMVTFVAEIIEINGVTPKWSATPF